MKSTKRSYPIFQWLLSRKTAVLTAILVSFFLSFKSYVYLVFQPRVGVGWAYVIDQMLPLFITSLICLMTFRKQVSVSAMRVFLQRHGIFLLILVGITVFTHSGLLHYYFFAEDSVSILRIVTNGFRNFPFRDYIIGYPDAAFVFSYLVFGTHALLYNFVTIGFFVSSVIATYVFLYVLTKNRFIAFVAVLFYATTPSYLDVFTWMGGNAHATFIFTLCLTSLTFLFLHQTKNNFSYYLFSLLFFGSALKLGFIPSAGVFLVSLYLIVFPKKRKKSILWSFIECLPLLFIQISIIYAQQMPHGIDGLVGLIQKYGFGVNSLTYFNYRPLSATNYIPTFVYYLTHLFFPTQLAREFIPLARWIGARFFFGIKPVSIIFIVGKPLLLVFITLIALGFIKRKTRQGWLLLFSIFFIIANLFYIPFYVDQSHREISRFDDFFTRTSLGYGPGSRYVFFSSLGVSLLFGLGIYWLCKKKKKFSIIGGFFFLVIIFFQIWSTTSVYARNVKELVSYKTLIKQIFSLVPRDGEPKLIYSLNPEKNALDTKIGGWHWMHGFYKESEFTYSKNLEEVKKLIATKQYKKENIYAFYNNPGTLVFADVSNKVREELFPNVNLKKEEIPIDFLDKGEVAPLKQEGNLSVVNRVLSVSRSVDKRIVVPKTLHMSFTTPVVLPTFPFSDSIVASLSDKAVPYKLWVEVKNAPPLFGKDKERIFSSLKLYSSEHSQSLTTLSIPEKRRLAEIIAEREKFRAGLSIDVSNINTQTPSSVLSSLIDGMYASYPSPGGTDTYFLAESSPVEIVITFPYPILLGRLLINTPRTKDIEHSPTDLTVFSSLYGSEYTEVGSLQSEIKTAWSPNGGKTRDISLQHMFSDRMKIVVRKTTLLPILIDELVVDSNTALAFSPAQIYEYEQKAFWFMDSPDVLSIFQSIDKFKTFTVAYACAEDVDWKEQKDSKMAFVPGIWKIQEEQAQVVNGRNAIETVIDCTGSILRRVVLIGPPYPVKLDTLKASLY